MPVTNLLNGYLKNVDIYLERLIKNIYHNTMNGVGIVFMISRASRWLEMAVNVATPGAKLLLL